MMRQKNNRMEQLYELDQKQSEQKIITKEMLGLNEEIKRVEEWRLKAQSIEQQQYKVGFKQLQQVVLEYRNLIVEGEQCWEKLKMIYEQCQLILKQINQVSKVQKTRNNRDMGVKMGWEQAEEIYQQIKKIGVYHDEFKVFIEQYEQSRRFNEQCQQFMERGEQNGKVLNGLIREGGYQLIESGEYRRLLGLQEYQQIVERIKKLMKQRGRNKEIQEDFERLKEKGWSNREVLELEKGWEEIMGINEIMDRLVNVQQNYSLEGFILGDDEQILDQFVSNSQFEGLNSGVLQNMDKQQMEWLEELKQQYQQNRNKGNRQLDDLRERMARLRERWMVGVMDDQLREELSSMKRRMKIYMGVMNFIDKYDKENKVVEEMKGIIEGIDEEQLRQIMEKIDYQDIFGVKSDYELLSDLKDMGLEVNVANQIQKMVSRSREWEQEGLQIIQIVDIEIHKQNEMQIDINLQNQQLIDHHLQVQTCFPINQLMKKQLEDQRYKLKWIKQVYEILWFSDELIDQEVKELEDIGVIEIMQQMEQAKVSYENDQKLNSVDHHSFYRNNYKTIFGCAQLIVNNNKLYKRKTRLNVFIQKQLLKEGQNQGLDQIHGQIMATLNENVRKFEVWQKKFRTIVTVEKKKKIIQRKNVNKESNEVDEEERVKKLMKKKEQRFYYYYKLPQLICLYYQLEKYQIYAEEGGRIFGMVDWILQQIKGCRKFVSKCNRQLSDLQQVVRKEYGCFIPEVSYLKKLEKWTLKWKSIAETVIDSIPYTRVGVQQKQGLNRLPDDLANNYLLEVDVDELAINIIKKQNEKQQVNKRQRQSSKLFRDNNMTIFNLSQLICDKKHKKVKMSRPISNLIYSENNTVVNKYCICRKDYDGQVLMIMCDHCEEWFHIECIGLKHNHVKIIEKKNYSCWICSQINRGNYVQYNDYIWNRFVKMEYQQWRQLIDEGQQLKLRFNEKTVIQQLDQQISQYYQQLQNSIEKCCDSQQIFDLLNEGLGLPVLFPQFDQLLLILQKREFETQIVNIQKKKNIKESDLNVLDFSFSVEPEYQQRINQIRQQIMSNNQSSRKIQQMDQLKQWENKVKEAICQKKEISVFTQLSQEYSSYKELTEQNYYYQQTCRIIKQAYEFKNQFLENKDQLNCDVELVVQYKKALDQLEVSLRDEEAFLNRRMEQMS